jgi:hypothetical protein
MTQDEKWKAKYNEVVEFIQTNHRNPSKYAPEERNMYNYIKHTRKQMNQGLLKENRIEMFKRLLGLMEQYKRVNQYL